MQAILVLKKDVTANMLESVFTPQSVVQAIFSRWRNLSEQDSFVCDTLFTVEPYVF